MDQVYAQEELINSKSDEITELSKKLQLKLLLDNDQFRLIDSSLLKMLPETIQESDRDSILNSVNNMIEQILNARQKIKFEIIKDNWLDELVVKKE